MQLLRLMAFPISLVYALVVYLRNLLYDLGVFKSTSFKTPTICIGNLSVGGTGKTPMIEFILRLFQDDYKIAVLSRGYRRKTKGFLLADKNSTVKELGDEPFQIYSKFKGIFLAVDENRGHGISNLENLVKPDLILLDDAFQHRKVKPSFSILLTTYDNLYVNGWYLPTGDLRDSKMESKRADIIAITKCPENITKKQQQKVIIQIKPKEHQKVIFGKLVYSDFLVGENDKIPLSHIKGKYFSLVTGIANPEPLVLYLKSISDSFEHFSYKDHHFFNEDDIASFSKNELVITTEKDFTKLNGRCENLFYLEMKHEFQDDGKSIIKESIRSLMPDFPVPSSS
ncbi:MULTISPECIES: tetraacyldisaccharide 4'-kinase [unclassified Croceitalea]|uniref:tetraacyldisaccharide 4'-kinase n=1 Tax=unclassified Croceitalea TaxID=2632280 RepID=UPI0030DA1169